MNPLALSTNEISPDKKADLIERHFDAESKWDGICLLFGIAVFVIYVTPIAGIIQKIWKATVGVSKAAIEATENSINYWAPDLQKAPKVGDKISGYAVTSPFGERKAPCSGCSGFHKGVDIGTPSGTSVYLFGKPGQKITVKCWWDDKGGGQVAEFESMGFKFKYLHLIKGRCASGSQTVGQIIGSTGATGVGTAAHFHFQQEKSGKAIEPITGFVWGALTGDLPAPLVVQGKEDEHKH
jgi:hypothetical protein